jgi:hypothetical protein
MSRKPSKEGRNPKGRSPAQQLGSAAMTQVMNAWEDLSDEERLVWRVQASTQRKKGVAFFKQVNLRRVRRGEQWVRLPPRLKVYDGLPILNRLVIQNQGGRLTLKLELRRPPSTPTTVWGALPCNRGLERPDKCPRLGWLLAPEDGVCDISRQYYQKHGEYLKTHSVHIIGKRIFIRTRQESDDGPALYEEVKAVVPAPEGRAGRQKSPIPFEAPS